MTSFEEFLASNPAYPCCSVRGSVVALNAATGAILWQTFTVPAGYSGGMVNGGNPVVDEERGMGFRGDGNNYTIPTDPAYLACVSGGGSRAACQSPDNHADSLLSRSAHGRHQMGAPAPDLEIQPYATDGSDFWNTDCRGVLGPL